MPTVQSKSTKSDRPAPSSTPCRDALLYMQRVSPREDQVRIGLQRSALRQAILQGAVEPLALRADAADDPIQKLLLLRQTAIAKKLAHQMADDFCGGGPAHDADHDGKGNGQPSVSDLIEELLELDRTIDDRQQKLRTKCKLTLHA